MYRDGTDENNVQMEDVLCDFCHRVWTADEPFLEGHRGSMICGKCLSVAFAQLMTDGPDIEHGPYECRMSREGEEDRAALRRAGEPGWRSPVDPDAVVSRKVVRMAAAVLQKDPDWNWSKPKIPE